MRCLALCVALGVEPDWLDFELDQPDFETEADTPSQLLDATRCGAALGNHRCDLLIVDHYGLGAAWEAAVRPHTRLLLAIDDLGRAHADGADILLDQNLPDRTDWYPGRALVGPPYALLRPEFGDLAGRFEVRPALSQILVNFGGGDELRLAEWVVSTVLGAPGRQADSPGERVAQGGESEGVASGAPARLTVISPHFPVNWQHPQLRVLSHASNMSELMLAHDLMIGGGGSTSWERCALGMPSIVIGVAANQHALSQALHERGASHYLGPFRPESPPDLPAALQQLQPQSAREAMHQRATQVTDGRGALRVAKIVQERLSA